MSQVQMTVKWSWWKIYKHGKPVNISHCSYLNSDTDSDNTYGGNTDDSTNHHVYNYDLTPFYHRTISSIQKNHFC